MGFFRRLGNIVSANLNDLLDRCENPEKLLQQATRGMEASLRSALAGAAKVIAHEHVLARRLTETEAAAVAWRRQAESAVAAGDDAAARLALRGQRECQERGAALAAERHEAQAMSRLLRRQLDELRRRLHEARRRRDMLIARSRATQARRELFQALGDLPWDTDAFREFDRMSERVSQAEAEAAAMADLAGAATITLGAAAQDEREAWVERELRDLKKPS
jgi:phage shock protein A